MKVELHWIYLAEGGWHGWVRLFLVEQALQIGFAWCSLTCIKFSLVQFMHRLILNICNIWSWRCYQTHDLLQKACSEIHSMYTSESLKSHLINHIWGQFPSFKALNQPLKFTTHTLNKWLMIYLFKCQQTRPSKFLIANWIGGPQNTLNNIELNWWLDLLELGLGLAMQLRSLHHFL